VVTVNVTEVFPAGTIAVVGTVAAPLLLDSATLVPPGPAGPFNVTVPVAVAPPEIVVGLSVTALKLAGVMERVAVLAPVPVPAVITAVVFEFTPVVPIVNVAVVEPAATGTELGAKALALLDERGTEAPPAGAGAARFTVPVAEVPPSTEDGLIFTLLTPTEVVKNGFGAIAKIDGPAVAKPILLPSAETIMPAPKERIPVL
jgi:hypothetical protein